MGFLKPFAARGCLLAVAVWFFCLEAAGQEREICLDVDAVPFMVNNEYYTLMEGYTLPGFRLTPTICYKHSSLLRLEAGAALLHYWGASAYPNRTYLGLPQYQPDDNSKGLHCVPFLRACMDTDFGLRVVLGNIYGGESHGLLAPLYDPELALTADPEMGFQLLYSGRWADVDAWVDWRSCIFYDSPYKENFYVGLSARLRYNSPAATVHFYSPVQAVIEHIGGEIDTHPGAVQTFTNGAVGFGARYNGGSDWLQWVQLEGDAIGSYQQAGTAWRLKKGWSAYAHADAQIRNFTATLGYYHAHDFSPILGLPLWGCASTKVEGATMINPSTVYLGAEYAYQPAKGFLFKAFVKVYRLMAGDKFDPEVLAMVHDKGSTSCSVGVSMSITPSFVLKRL